MNDSIVSIFTVYNTLEKSRIGEDHLLEVRQELGFFEHQRIVNMEELEPYLNYGYKYKKPCITIKILYK